MKDFVNRKWVVWTGVVILVIAWIAFCAYDPILAYVVGFVIGVMAIAGGLLVLAWDDDKRKQREWRYLQTKANMGETVVVYHKGRMYVVPRSS